MENILHCGVFCQLSAKNQQNFFSASCNTDSNWRNCTVSPFQGLARKEEGRAPEHLSPCFHFLIVEVNYVGVLLPLILQI